LRRRMVLLLRLSFELSILILSEQHGFNLLILSGTSMMCKCGLILLTSVLDYYRCIPSI
jgi:hypothetical protein